MIYIFFLILSCPYLHLIFSAGWWRILLKRSAQTGDIFNRVKCQRHSIDPQIKTDTSKGKTRLLRRAQPRASGWKSEQTDAFQNTPSSITTEVKLIWSDSPPFKQQSPSEKSQFCSGLSLTPSLSYTWTGGWGGGGGVGGGKASFLKSIAAGMRRVRGQCEESWGIRHAKSCFSLSACGSVFEDVRRNARTPTHTLTDEDESVSLSTDRALPHSHAASFLFSALARQKEPQKHKHSRRRCWVRLVAKHLVEAANTNPITSIVSSYCINAWSLVLFSSTENMKYCPPQHIYFIRIWFGGNTYWRQTGCFLKGHRISCITLEK